MKKITILIIIVFVAIGLNAQTNSMLKNSSFELLFGLGKVAIMGNNNFVYSLGNSPKYESEYITKKGIEADIRVSSNWSIKERNEIILGLNLSTWGRESLVTNGDIIANWQEASIANRNISGQIDLILGYRFLFMDRDKIDILVEGVFHKKLFSGK